MKRMLLLFSALLGTLTTLTAKKVELTIDGTVSPGQTTLYLIINEDIEHARLLPINDGRFSVTVTVDANAFVRLHDYKEWPERSSYVLIPDSRHITLDLRRGTITGSPWSTRLQEAIQKIRNASPEGFHIDVFSDDRDAWARAREAERDMRAKMEAEQIEIIAKVMSENKNNNIPAWIAYCYPQFFDRELSSFLNTKAKWRKHPILNKREAKERP